MVLPAPRIPAGLFWRNRQFAGHTGRTALRLHSLAEPEYNAPIELQKNLQRWTSPFMYAPVYRYGLLPSVCTIACLTGSAAVFHIRSACFSRGVYQIFQTRPSSSAREIYSAATKASRLVCVCSSIRHVLAYSPPIRFRMHLSFGAGKTTTHCGGNIADVVMFPKCWLALPRAQHLWRTRILCPGHKKVFLKIFRNMFLCPRGAQKCCRVLPRTGNIAGHNVAATMCPRFAGAYGFTKI